MRLAGRTNLLGYLAGPETVLRALGNQIQTHQLQVRIDSHPVDDLDADACVTVVEGLDQPFQPAGPGAGARHPGEQAHHGHGAQTGQARKEEHVAGLDVTGRLELTDPL